MIDIHSHILPGLDDGASDINETLKMAKAAVQDGVTDIIATPHTYKGYHNYSPVKIIERINNVQELLNKLKIPVRIHPGSEVHLHYNLLNNLKRLDVLTLCNFNKHILLELPDDSIPLYIDHLFNELLKEDYVIIIAHPERNKVFQKRPFSLYSLISNGVFAQVTAGSILGHWGNMVKRTANIFIKYGLVQILASDAHNNCTRSYQLTKAYELLKNLTDLETVELYKKNSNAILKGSNLLYLPKNYFHPNHSIIREIFK